MHRRVFVVFGLALVAAPSLGCGLEAIDDGDGTDALPAAVQEAFDESCATSSACHATGASLVVLSAPESAAILTASSSSGGGPFVTLGDLDNSYLAQKILAGPGIIGGPMPPGPQSEDDDLNKAIIVGWIAGVPIDDGSAGDGDGDGDGDPSGDGDGDPSGDGDGDGEPLCFIDAPIPADPSFAADIWPIVEGRCATMGCHLNISQPLMPDAAGAYANLIDMSPAVAEFPFVVAGDPDGSYLWHKLAGTQASVPMGGGSTMPSGGELCPAELQAFYAWILAGAAE